MTAPSGRVGSEIPARDAARLVASGPFGYVATSGVGNIELVNATMLEWLGYELAELRGKRSLQQLLAPGDRIYFDTHIRPLLHMGGSVREIAVEFERRDGTRLPALINSQVLEPSTNAPDGFSIETIVIDATMRRTYELELLREREAAEESERRLQLMYDLVSRLASASTVDEVSEVVSGVAVSPFTGVRCNVWLFGPDRRSAVRSGDADPTAGLTEVMFDEATRGDAVRTLAAGKLVVVEHLDDAEELYPLLTKWLRVLELGSAVIAPLIDDGDLFGVLSFGLADPHQFGDKDRRAVEALAAQTEQAWRRAHLHQMQQRSRARLERLHEFSRSLAGAMSLRDVTAAIRHGGHELLGAADVRIARFNESGAELVLAGGPASATAPDIRLPVDRPSIAAEAIKRGAIVRVESRDELSARFPASPILADTDLDSVVAAPLRAGGEVAGAWILGFDEAGPIEDDDDTLMELFADEAGQALRRAMSHEREAAARRRSDRRRVMSEALNGAATTEAVGEALLVSGQAAFNADGIAMLLVDDDAPGRLVLRSHAGLAADAVASLGHARSDSEAVQRLTSSPSPIFANRPSAVAELLDDAFDFGRWGAAAVLPLGSPGQSIGMIVLLYRTPATLDDETCVGLSGIAAEISVAIGRARAYDLEREVAVTLQRSLLSMEVPDIEGWSVDAWYSPGHRHLTVGGDLFDVTCLDDGRIIVLVGDVVGHGLAAAASLGQLRSASKALSLGATRPSELLNRLDEFARLTPGVFGSSLCCAIIEPNGAGRYACAGHPFPILKTAGDAALLCDGRSSLLGLGSGERGDAEFAMRPSSSLVLYTDGVVERRRSAIDHGIDRLRELVERVVFTNDHDHAHEIGTTMLADGDGDDDAVVVCVTRLV